jgi:hypothetical protein
MYKEVDIFGVYVAPFSVLLVMAAILFAFVRRYLDSTGFHKTVWHPQLVSIAIYVIILSILGLFL